MAIAACFLWSTAFAAVKIGLPFTTPLKFAGTRFVLSGLLILPMIPGLYQKIAHLRPWLLRILLVGFLQTFLQYGLFYTGIGMVPGSIGALVVGSGPLFAALVAHFMMPGDMLNRRKLLSIALGLIGVGIISFSGKSMGGAGELLFVGIIILLANNLASGFVNVVVSRDCPDIHPLMLSSLSMLSGGTMLLITGSLTEQTTAGPYPIKYWAALAWLSFLSAAAISIWFTLLKRPGVKVSELNMWKFIIPVLGAVLSWLIIPGENPTIGSLTGMALISIALYAMSRKNMIRRTFVS